MNPNNLDIVLDFTESIITQADLLIDIFESRSSIHDKMEFLMVWMEGFKKDVRGHSCLELIDQIRNET